MFVFNIQAQNIISVPFNVGFVGDKTANNVCSNSVYLSSLGWSNVQFAQSTSGTVFTAQGNDIIGMVHITDANGVEHTINGFVKWRAPSGTVTALVFSPSSTVVLATNGSNGSSTCTISSSKYIGLVFNGQSLSIPTTGNNAGQVSGNAATSDISTTLNDYLGSLPSITISDLTVNESSGIATVTVTLSVSASSQVTFKYTTADGTALLNGDYGFLTGTITISSGQTSSTISIPLTVDNIAEYDEIFYIVLSDATNASIIKSTSTISIYDSTLPVELLSIQLNCLGDGKSEITWTTASEHNSSYFDLQKSRDGYNWGTFEVISAAGNSNNEINYSIVDNNIGNQMTYYKLVQYDLDGASKEYDAISSSCTSFTDQLDVIVFPNPSNESFTIQMALENDGLVNMVIYDVNGNQVISKQIKGNEGLNNVYMNDVNLKSGFYFIHLVDEKGKSITIKHSIL